MKRPQLQLGLPRRVVVYYLLFSLIPVCWLAAGAAFVVHSVLLQRDEAASLSQLGRTAAAVEIAYLQHGESRIGELLAQTRNEGKFAYCSLVGIDGRYVAHSNPRLAGKTAAEPQGKHLNYEAFESVRFVDGVGRTLREYRAPLRAHRKDIGFLRIASVEPLWQSTLRQTATATPLLTIVPLALVAIGAVVVGGSARPLAAVDAELRRLARLPFDRTPDPQPQRPATGAALGFNRLAGAFDELQQQAAEAIDTTTVATDSASPQETAELLAHLSDGIAVTDPAHNILLANPALGAALGLDRGAESPVGKTMDDLLEAASAADDEPLPAELRDAEHRARPLVFQCNTGRDDAGRVLRISRQPQRTAAGEVQGFVWTVRDITQQTRALKAREQFIDAVTHELRTPLANIKAYAETLASLDATDIEAQKEFSNTINAESTRLARFVDDLLDVSSLEVGGISLARQTVDTQRFIEEAAAKVRPLAAKKSQTLDVQLPAKLPEASLDKDKVSATLVNLLGNACKYTPAGGRITLRVKADDGTLDIDVEDTGVGISPEDVPRVFEKFFRSNDPRVTGETGTGLGLALAREVARLHGGDITVTSAVDQGSTFTLSLPLTAR
jgi:PAS domain S-box-containing protein